MVQWVQQSILITMSEASKIEEMYAANDMTVTMFKLGPNLVIDGHRTPESE